MGRVDYREPHTLDEACELVQRYADDGKILAGGTALVLLMRQRLLNPSCLLNIQHVGGLGGIALGDGASASAEARPSVRIGALTTHGQAARSDLIRGQYAALAQTFGHVATPRIRNAGTIGGNLAHGDPHLDPPVTLLALDARVTAQSVRGARAIPITAFFRDYYDTALAPDEILTQILVPTRAARSGLSFIKYLPRSQDDYATVDIAVWIKLTDSGRVEDAHIALGSVGPVPLRAHDAEGQLVGQALTDDLLAAAGELAAAACDPEDDVRGSPNYKRELVKVLVRRAVRQAASDAGA